MPVFIGGAWPYANGSLHVGHIAALLPGDSLARYHRQKGEEVLYVSGSEFEQQVPASGQGEILVYGNHKITLFDHTISEMTLTVKQNEADEIFGGGLGQGHYYQSAEGRAFYSEASSQALVESDLGDDVELILKRVGEEFLEEGNFEKVVVE